VAFVQGGVEVSKTLLEKRWDKIFFTGSTKVGKIVMKAAANHLTPVELELGGKNPVIVDLEANLKVAAKRIVWGKFLNAGQSCVSPDYLLVHEKIKDKFLPLLKKNIVQFFSENPKQSADFGRIVNRETTQRFMELIQNETIYFGGDSDDNENYISPTIVSDVQPDSALMQEEIFGPVLPVLTFKKLEEAIDFVTEREKPLAAYFFSENKQKQRFFLKHTYSGDASINEVVIHFTNFALPFGGVGYSGIGSYHGKHSFECFSHSRSVVKTPTFFDLPLRYPPVKSWVYQFMRLIFK
jgi:aldehyde dehydrogenase (NAD+)